MLSIYACFGLVILGFILYFYRYLEAVNFDPSFSETLGIRSKRLDDMMFFLIVLAIVVGIRSVGVVLMAGMLIGPAVAARPLTQPPLLSFCSSRTLWDYLGFLGNYLSVVVPKAPTLFQRAHDFDRFFPVLFFEFAIRSPERTIIAVSPHAAF